MKEVLKIYVPLIIVIAFVSFVSWKYYPVIRYEYVQSGETRIIFRIDRFSGDIYRLQFTNAGGEQGWHKISNKEYPQ